MSDLIKYPLEVARKLKWENGRMEHGPIMQLCPTEEAYAECCDLVNYLRDMLFADDMSSAVSKQKLRLAELKAREIGEIVRGLYLEREHEYVPREMPFRPVDADDFAAKVVCNNCGAQFPKLYPGFQQGDGCAAIVRGDQLQGFYGSSEADMDVYQIVCANVPEGNICDECIRKLRECDRLVLLREDVL